MRGESRKRTLRVVERRSLRSMGVEDRDALDDEGGQEQGQQGADPEPLLQGVLGRGLHVRTSISQVFPSRVMDTIVTLGGIPLSVKRMASPTSSPL